MGMGPLILLVFILSGCYIHFRGRVRHSFTRQLTSHTNLLAPYNGFVYCFSAVPDSPFHPRSVYPELESLQESWQTIRDEALDLLHAGQVGQSETHNDIAFNSFFKSGWSRFYLKWYDDFHPSALEHCPRTVDLLKNLPNVNAALFAFLPAGAELKPHRDPYAGSLRYHLGLVTPNSNECHITVDGETYSWRDGEPVIFDETYIHEAHNESSQDRLILFCDVERPMRGRLPAAINRWVSDHIIKSSATRNVPGERVGVLNRVFEYLYKARILGKQIKKTNRFVYYVIKYAIFFGLIWLLFL